MKKKNSPEVTHTHETSQSSNKRIRFRISRLNKHDDWGRSAFRNTYKPSSVDTETDKPNKPVWMGEKGIAESLYQPHSDVI